MNFKEAKPIARQFLRDAYNDTDLTKALDHMRAGQFHFVSCCCFVGIPTADHALQGHTSNWATTRHYALAQHLPNASAAVWAALWLGHPVKSYAFDNDILIRRLIPMILAEIKRRSHVRLEATPVIEPESCPVL